MITTATISKCLVGCASALISTGIAVTFNFEVNPWLSTFAGLSGLGGAFAGGMVERSTTNRRDYYRKSKVEQILKDAEAAKFGIEGDAVIHYIEKGLEDV